MFEVDDVFAEENSEKRKQISLYDPDTTDSGFHDENPSDVDNLIGMPMVLEDPEVTICFSLVQRDLEDTPNKKFVHSKKKRLFFSPDVRSPSQEAACNLKRLKIFCSAIEDLDDKVSVEFKAPRKIAESKDDIVKNAVEKSEIVPDLIGDFSKAYCLPLTTGCHPDLKSISVETMGDIVEGKYNDVLHSYKIVDSRYPYEFEGGHIKGAVNIYTKEECEKLLNESVKSKAERHVLIFHCEFSKERGPKMIRHLRQEDRQKNCTNYPDLLYPEIYVLEGGYKRFFEKFPQHCNPSDYKQMLHPDHSDDLRYFRKKWKSCDDAKKSGNRRAPERRKIRKVLSNVDF